MLNLSSPIFCLVLVMSMVSNAFGAAVEPQLIRASLDKEVVVADVVITKDTFDVDPSGQRDSTQAVQKAIDAVYAKGGGVVYLPEGQYRFDGNLNLPGGISLRGDWKSPLEGGSGKGTLLKIYAGRNDPFGKSFIRSTGGSSAVQNLSFWYPEQTLDDIRPYPPTIERIALPLMLKNLTFYNAYQGATIRLSGGCGLYDNIFGTFLHTGIQTDINWEYSFMTRIHISPSIWADAPRDIITNAPKDAAALREYCRANTTGLRILKADNLQLYDINVTDARTGIVYDKSPVLGRGGYGYTMKIRATEDRRSINPWIGDFLQVDRFPETADKFYDWAPNRSAAREDVLLNVREPRWGARADGATDDTAAIQAALNEAGRQGGGIVYLPAGQYAVKSNLRVPRGVELRGGYDYPHHGASSNTAVSVLLATAGANSQNIEKEPPFISLQENAGIRGLLIFYPEQSELYPDSVKSPPVKYPWTIRGEGKNVYVKYVTIKRAWNAIDLGQNDSSGFVLDGIWSAPLNMGVRVGGGTNGGWIQRMIQTMGAWHFPDRFTPQLVKDGVRYNPDGNNNQGKWFWGVLSDYFMENVRGYTFGDASNIQTFGAISFRLNRHMSFVQQNGKGPRDLDLFLSHSEDVGDIGLNFEAGDRIRFFGFASVPKKTGHMLETAESFAGTVDLFGLMMWGEPPGATPKVRGGKVNIYPLTPKGVNTASITPEESKGLIKPMNSFKQKPFDEVIKINGKSAWLISLDSGPNQQDIFSVDLLVDYDTFRFGGAPKVTLEIEYLDRGQGTMQVIYDAEGDFKRRVDPVIKLNNTDQWKTVRVPLTEAKFARSMKTYPRNGDIRIEIKNSLQPIISSIKLHKESK